MLYSFVVSITFSSEEIYLQQAREGGKKKASKQTKKRPNKPCGSNITFWRMVLEGLQSKKPGAPVGTAVGMEPSGTQEFTPGLNRVFCWAPVHQEHLQQQVEGERGCSCCFLTASITWGWQRSISEWGAPWDFLSAFHSKRETLS